MKQRTSLGQHTLDREYFVSKDIFEAEHERMSRAMEFFRRRLAVMPDSPRQGHG